MQVVGSGHSETTDLEEEEERPQAQGVNIKGDIFTDWQGEKERPQTQKIGGGGTCISSLLQVTKDVHGCTCVLAAFT